MSDRRTSSEIADPPVTESNAVLDVRGLDVAAAGRPIVRGLSLRVGAGETVAIVGESGSGKSLAARAITGLLPPGLSASGRLRLQGFESRERRDSGTGGGADTSIELSDAQEKDWAGIRGAGIALLLQDPFTSLSPVHTVGRQIATTLAARRDLSGGAGVFTARSAGKSREIRARIADHLAEVGLPERAARQYPHQLSGGMRQRAAIAAALAAGPAVLIADEPTTALDASTQGEILSLITALKRARGLSVVLISHDLDLVRGHADAVTVMLAGSAVERGATSIVLGAPVHPYTAGLLAAAPSIDRRVDRLPTVPWIPRQGSLLPAGFDFGEGYAGADRVRELPPPQLLRLSAQHEVAAYPPGAALPPSAISSASDPSLADAAISGADPRGQREGEVVLRATGLAKRFGSRHVLDDVSFELRRGEVLGIVGESGSGKTTLVRCIVGLEQADQGTVAFAQDGEPRGRSRRASSAGNGVQIVFQDPASAVNPAHTVGFSLREVLRIAGRPLADAGALLEKVGLPARLAERRPRDLSGGQRQRVAIARALALDPEILICDESVSALDVSVQAQILNLLADLRGSEGLSLIFISHDLGVINQLADRVLVLREGRVVESGPRLRVLSDPQHPYTRQLVGAARASEAQDSPHRPEQPPAPDALHPISPEETP